jgi:hypothetical protein
LCYSSTLYTTLNPAFYPWPSTAGIYSPGVVVFRDDLNHDCQDLPEDEWRVVSVVSVAAPRHPKLRPDGELASARVLEELREKIRLVYRIAASNGNEYLVLGVLL